jgi:hypothetical protein
LPSLETPPPPFATVLDNLVVANNLVDHGESMDGGA